MGTASEPLATSRTPTDQHLTILGMLHLAYGLLVAVLASFAIIGVLILAWLMPVTTDATRGASVWPAYMVAIGIILLALLAAVFAPLGIISGIGLLRRRPWARTLALIQGVLILFNVPLGTALGIYTIWVLTRQDVAQRLVVSPPQPGTAH